MKSNLLMIEKIGKSDWKNISLPEELQLWIERGFIRDEGCVFLTALFNSNPGVNRLSDKTGVECFVNSFHIDDYVSERYLDYACLFCNEILYKWADSHEPEFLNVIISLDEFGAVIKVHVKRNDESWLSDNLDKYEEAILETSTPV